MQKGISALKIGFTARSNKMVKGLLPIYARIRGLGAPVEVSLGRYVSPDIWDSQTGRAVGRGNSTREINDFLENVIYDFRSAYREIYNEGRDVTAHALKARFLGQDDEPMGLLEMFDYHWKREKGKLNPSTLKNYKTTRQYVAKYIRAEFKRPDYPLEKLNYAFIDGFEVYLRNYEKPETARPLRNNGIMKHMERLQKVVNLAVKLDKLVKNPFSLYRRKMERVEQTHLSMEELEAIQQLQIEMEGHRLVRDLFVFACYTGIAYVDLMKLTPDRILVGIDRMLWVRDIRTKSGQPYKVPLLPVAEEIYLRYIEHPASLDRGTCFPGFSAQKINKYLKEIALEAGVKKNITYYAARHTFATTITLSNGVPIESVSKMLGHTKLTTTQIYAKVIDAKLSHDMSNLKKQLSDKDGNSLKRVL